MAKSVDTKLDIHDADTAVMAFGSEHGHYTFWALNEDDVLSGTNVLSSKHSTDFYGPGIVYREISRGFGTTWHERYVRDQNTKPENVWQWIQRLITTSDSDSLEPMTVDEWRETYG